LGGVSEGKWWGSGRDQGEALEALGVGLLDFVFKNEKERKGEKSIG